MENSCFCACVLLHWVETDGGLSMRVGECIGNMGRIQLTFHLSGGNPNGVALHAADRKDAVELPTISGGIEFDNVVFSYDGENNALDGVSFRIKAGEMVGLSGPSGAGKTLGALGSNCCIDSLVAVAKGNELCNAYGLDTIGVGTTIAFAMECFENGIMTEQDTDGIQLNFGNADAMVKMVEKIAKREGVGDLLAEGCKRAAEKIGKGASKFAMHSKGQEFPMHMPRYKPGMGMGYAISPTGADHMQGMHDARSWDLGPDKVRNFIYRQFWSSFRNCAGMCVFLPYSRSQYVEIVHALTGWNMGEWDMMKLGERALTMTRAFNVREGFTKEDDVFPKRIHQEFTSGPLEGRGYGEDRLSEAVSMYYDMMGWDRETGVPRKGKLQELDIEWVADLLDS